MFDASPDEIESLDELSAHVSARSLAGLTIQGLHITVDLTEVDVTETLFVGCRFATTAHEASVVERGAHVVPEFDDVPYPTHPNRLYTAADLVMGFAEGGAEQTYDNRVYRHYLAHGGAHPTVREALAQRLHDQGIDDALAEAAPPRETIVGIMGGHDVPRGAPAYRLAAALGHRLACAGRTIVTGGGPGVMEAANLGAYLSSYSAEALDEAIERLAAAPDFRVAGPYTATALGVRAVFPVHDPNAGGLAIPTWLYGHEPANLFAGRIGKYFSNAIREDVILGLARGGIVFAPGRAGTVQEVFQAATKTFYRTDGDSGPFVFLGRDFWTRELPVASLLAPLLAGAREGDLSGLIHLTDDVDEAVALLTARP